MGTPRAVASLSLALLLPACTHDTSLPAPSTRPNRPSGSASATSNPTSTGAGRDWRVYLGDKGSTHYSTLDQINRGNVTRLQVAWTFETGDKGEFQTNNLIIDGVLYTASPSRKLIALHAGTGKEIWRFDPKSERDDLVGNRQRGLVYWESGDDRRIFTSAGTWLYAVNARSGELIRSFGDNGSIHLGRGLGLGGTPSVISVGTVSWPVTNRFWSGRALPELRQVQD